jgi:uncharacterized protein (TIGR02270 family)
MPDLSMPPVMIDLLEEHLEELDFLWEQRERVLVARDRTLAELGDLERRADAHLDGLRLSGGHAVELARPLLAGQERGAAVAATFVFMSTGHLALQAEAVCALAGGSAAADGVRIGLRYSDVSAVVSELVALASSGASVVRARACDVLAFHQLARPQQLAELLRTNDPVARRLATAAAGRFGGFDLAGALDDIAEVGDLALLRTAFEAAARSANPGLAPALRRLIRHGSATVASEALRGLGILGDRADRSTLLASLQDPSRANGALCGLGALGDPTAVPHLFEAMDDDRTVLAAGAAFIRITAAKCVEADAPLPPPEEMSEAEAEFWDGPIPVDEGRARQWWKANASRFAPEARWQVGVNAADASKHPEALDALPLEIRRDLYLSARARSGSYALGLEIEACTPAFGIGAALRRS